MRVTMTRRLNVQYELRRSEGRIVYAAHRHADELIDELLAANGDAAALARVETRRQGGIAALGLFATVATISAAAIQNVAEALKSFAKATEPLRNSRLVPETLDLPMNGATRAAEH